MINRTSVGRSVRRDGGQAPVSSLLTDVGFAGKEMAEILVVDDEMGIRELLSEILGDEGHVVTLAENAQRAREAMAATRMDLVLLDIKSGIPDVYRKATGRELQPTLDFARRLSERGTEEVWIRFVLVPGLTDAVENVEAVAGIVEQISVVTRVEVLPFHQMGRDKWATLKLPYKLADTSPPSKELIERVRNQFRARGITTY